MNVKIDKFKALDVANVYIKNGQVLKYRFSSNDNTHPDYYLGSLITPFNIIELESKYIERIEEIKERKIIESNIGINYIGFTKEFLSSFMNIEK
jgi:hypothetical protein